MILNHQQQLLAAHLTAHSAFDTRESEHVNRLLDFLRQQSEPFSRSTSEGHITASAVLVDEDMRLMALIWHEKLQRWLQPGGHCEPGDSTIQNAALRELVEETTIPADAITLMDEAPFDVDVHPIPERGSEAAHFHYDVRYLFQTRCDLLPSDASQFRWMTFEALAAMPDESLARFGHKLLQRYTP